MSEITIRIEVPGLVQALENLIATLSANSGQTPVVNQGPTTTAQVATAPQVQPTQPASSNSSAPTTQPQSQQGQPQAPQTAAPTVPTAPQTYTLDQLAVAGTQLIDSGRQGELVQLLQSFGVQALTALPPEQYGAFATQLRGMGAKI